MNNTDITLERINQITPQLSIKMIKVEGGRFMMGSNELDREQPIHEVSVPDFYLGKYPITNEQFLPFLNAIGNQEEGGRKWVNIEGVRCGIFQNFDSYECKIGKEKHPMIYVSWYGARAYCKWLSKENGKDYRLPTESEWEYAARGGKLSKSYPFSGGHKLKEVGWYDLKSHGELKTIGQKKPNELGLYDMSGDAWEWCVDYWHESYKGAPQDGSAWVKGGSKTHRVVRGGAWDFSDYHCRVSNRSRFVAYDRDDLIGFRITRY